MFNTRQENQRKTCRTVVPTANETVDKGTFEDNTDVFSGGGAIRLKYVKAEEAEIAFIHMRL